MHHDHRSCSFHDSRRYANWKPCRHKFLKETTGILGSGGAVSTANNSQPSFTPSEMRRRMIALWGATPAPVLERDGVY